ncbi:flavin reductase family protein [Xanthobacter autotrophicus]|uniref:flavin reductase family protein n=1 Tax=Xanthobacter autotrophicus TaxID=280 RepID=UPI0024A74B0A|nr:flavin reductase family protein [Xanthobacter autotrophicus]MDI4655323.1 flavin reductase family protein [Xanthobacter autotrophicus]
MKQEIRDQFRQAMRRMAATVSVITTCQEGENFGMTASAVTSLSMDPPSLLVCVNKSAGFHDVITSTDHFCVNILRHGQEDISAVFGGKLPHSERFSTGSWSFDGTVPYLKESQAAIFCRRAGIFEHGTHSIIVGEAVDLIIGHPVMPLIYSDGRYSTVA